ncbi:MAG: diguanylate cyclase [Terracidiphilus sp.]
MSVRQFTPWGKKASEDEPKPAIPENAERLLTLLVEGAAMNTPAIDVSAYGDFRAKVTQLALQMRDGLPDDDKLALIRGVVREFEQHHKLSEDVLRDRLSAWRTLVSRLLVDLFSRMGLDSASTEAAPMLQRVSSLLTGEEIQGYLIELSNFLRVGAADTQRARAAQLTQADRTTANDNAAGLRGGGVAVEHVQRIMDSQGSGFVVLFKLNCLGMIGERFGLEAVQDSLMAVSAFLTHSLRSDDAIYSWSGSSLLAVLQTPASEQILSAAMRRIVDNNRDITIQMGGRSVMLRIPLEFQMTPISQLRSAGDLHKLSISSARKW